MIQAFLSEDAVLDVMRDPEIDLQADEQLQLQYHLGFEPMESKTLQGVVNVMATEVTCVYNPK